MLKPSTLRRTAPRKGKPRRAANADHDYLEWIRNQPCLICALRDRKQSTKTDPHHFGPRGFSQKVPDRQAIPLCHFEHHIFGREAIHVLGRAFGRHHGMDPEKEIVRLNAEYDANQFSV